MNRRISFQGIARGFFFAAVFGLTGAVSLPSLTAAQETDSLSNRLANEPIQQLISDARKFGDPARGAIAFYKPTMNCARCHEPAAANQKRRLGPDLTEKREADWAHLAQSVLQPSAKIKQGFGSVQVLLANGRHLTGVLVSQDDQGLVVDQIEANKPIRIDDADIDDFKEIKLSSMPQGLANQLSNRQQFLDLVSYLAEIATQGPARAAELKPGNLPTLAPLPEYESRIDHAGLIAGLDKDAFKRGEETYRLRCASCHGTIEEEGSMPTSLRFASGKFKNGNQPDQMYQTLTHGYGMMIPQRWMVPQQKYEVIHYIREHFLQKHNTSQLFEINKDYLAGLPKGDTRGPKPVVSRPWTLMDYGPSLINTIEVSNDGSNIAQKGIAVRLDDGPGGVESGSHWLMYEHDTMRVAGAWSGKFINWEGIHFNGAHGRAPHIAGKLHFATATGPGVGKPAEKLADMGNIAQGLFDDDRVVGRDGKHYGPLPHHWARYLGMYRFGKQTIIKYRVGETEILETPGLRFVESKPVFTRTLNIGQRDKDVLIKVAQLKGQPQLAQAGKWNVILPPSSDESPTAKTNTEKNQSKKIQSDGIKFDGSTFAEIENGDQFDMTDSDYSIYARIKTRADGTIFSQTKNQQEWIPQGKTLFIRNGRPTFDIGWVGDVQAKKRINDGKWHDVVMTWASKNKEVRFYVDGQSSGRGRLGPRKKIDNQVVRIGYTNGNFPQKSFFKGAIGEVRFYQRLLSKEELKDPSRIQPRQLMGTWNSQRDSEIPEAGGNKKLTAKVSRAQGGSEGSLGLAVFHTLKDASWIYHDEQLILRIPAGEPVNLVLAHQAITGAEEAKVLDEQAVDFVAADLKPLTAGGPANYPQTLTSKIIRGDDSGPFAVDVFQRPTRNPWSAQLRLTGLDFLPDGNTAIVSAWDGSVWRVTGFGSDTSDQLSWQRIAAGLFQPLGVKIQNDKIYVTCRDQIVILHDLNGDHEADWYENFNSDHQVTEHFHEFAMGLQSDQAGNFYYAKSARHGKKAVVPHHGTLLKVSPDGSQTEILATGFRAANGVCLNPDGSFVVTDQEGHWNPKNRINWVRPGQFYGNMFGYHDVSDDSDEAMSNPLCWITNEFDRSPSELLWVKSQKWGPLNGSLLNLSYGFGKIYVVPHEEVAGQKQGGMVELPIQQFPTGVMRGRFHPGDGQLYCCGMFAWAGTQQQPGGLYRIRYTGNPVHLPVGLNASEKKIKIKFSGSVDPQSVTDPDNFAINTWDLKRTAKYGSKHYNPKRLKVANSILLSDNQTVELTIPDLAPTWGMEINYAVKTKAGKELKGKIHNSIYNLPEGNK